MRYLAQFTASTPQDLPDLDKTLNKLYQKASGNISYLHHLPSLPAVSVSSVYHTMSMHVNGPAQRAITNGGDAKAAAEGLLHRAARLSGGNPTPGTVMTISHLSTSVPNPVCGGGQSSQHGRGDHLIYLQHSLHFPPRHQCCDSGHGLATGHTNTIQLENWTPIGARFYGPIFPPGQRIRPL